MIKKLFIVILLFTSITCAQSGWFWWQENGVTTEAITIGALQE